MFYSRNSDVPGSISVKVATLDHHSLSVSWEEEEKDSVSSGYIIKYKSHLDNWEELKIMGKRNGSILENLRCGTKYQITASAYNKAGRSDPSPVVTAATAGNGKSSLQLMMIVRVIHAMHHHHHHHPHMQYNYPLTSSKNHFPLIPSDSQLHS